MQPEAAIGEHCVTGFQTLALPIYPAEVIRAARASGKQVGVSLRMEEPLDLLEPYWDQLDTLCIIGTAIGIKGAGLDESRSEERRVGKESRSRWSPYH